MAFLTSITKEPMTFNHSQVTVESPAFFQLPDSKNVPFSSRATSKTNETAAKLCNRFNQRALEVLQSHRNRFAGVTFENLQQVI